MSTESSTHGSDGISFAFGFGRRVWYDIQNSANKAFCVNVNSVGRHVADASLFAAIVNILAVFRVGSTPGWNVGIDCEGVEWTEGLTT
jgi:hypothetical protein